ncbi:transposase [Streptomyces sclerotialus]|uniref:transposase n=1 Tax=Streptomyces sclerotialus TaxID=1957 RepID=UPI000690E321
MTVAWADYTYGGELIPWTKSFLGIALHTVPRREDQDGFAVLAKRWRVERAISWIILRARRHVRDHERLISHSEAHLIWTMITLLVRRHIRPPRPPAHHLPTCRAHDGNRQAIPVRLRTRPQSHTVRLVSVALP